MKASKGRSDWRVHSLQCGSRGEIRELAGFSRGFQRTTARVRISTDCVAERKTFELSVPFPEPVRARTVRELHFILQQQHTVRERDKGSTYLGPVRFHDFEKGEWQAIVRPNEIRMYDVLPTFETVSEDYAPAGQSGIEHSL